MGDRRRFREFCCCCLLILCAYNEFIPGKSEDVTPFSKKDAGLFNIDQELNSNGFNPAQFDVRSKTWLQDMEGVATENCTADQMKFALSSSSFFKCLVMHASPLRLCEKCVVYYESSYITYENMSQHCTDTLFKADRVQVISMVFTDMKAVWSDSDCPQCFSSISEENGTVTYTLSNDTEDFRQLYNDTWSCFLRTNGSSVSESPENQHPSNNASLCVACKRLYRLLNNHFESMIEKTNHKVCMDIVDMMNQTRKAWSNVYHCSHRYGTDLPVGIIGGIMGLLPFVFYGTTKIWGSRTQKKIIKQKRLRVPIQDSFYGSVSLSADQPIPGTSQT